MLYKIVFYKNISSCIYIIVRFYFYTSQNILVRTCSCSKIITGGQIFCLSMEEDSSIYSLDGVGVVTVTKESLLNRTNNQIKFYEIGQDVLCEILPFDCQGQFKSYRLKNKFVKFYNIKEKSLLCVCGEKCVINAEFDKFTIKTITKDKCCIYILVNTKSKWLIVLTDEKIIFNGKYVDFEELKNEIKIYTHNPNVYNVGTIIKYDLQKDEKSFSIVNDKGVENGLMDEEFTSIYFLEAIMCGRLKLAYSKISYELKSSISQEILGKYFGEIDDYIYLQNCNVFVTKKNNNIVGVYHIVVNQGLITAIY